MDGRSVRIAIDGFEIRPWRRSDVPALARHANNRRISRWLRDSFPYPYGPADARRWIRHTRRLQPPTQFAIATPEEAIGGIGLELGRDIHALTAEIGYWVAEPYWGRGIATRAVRALTRYGFERLGLVRIQAGVLEGNRASMRVLEKAGYRLEARLRDAACKEGRILDELIYVILRRDAAGATATAASRAP